MLAAIHLGLHDLFAGVQASENYNGVHHVGVLCKDITDSLKFYQDVLGESCTISHPLSRFQRRRPLESHNLPFSRPQTCRHPPKYASILSCISNSEGCQCTNPPNEAAFSSMQGIYDCHQGHIVCAHLGLSCGRRLYCIDDHCITHTQAWRSMLPGRMTSCHTKVPGCGLGMR